MNLKKIISKAMMGSFLLASPTAAEPLYVNTEITHYQMDKGQDEGEKDLARISLTDKLEESWLFVKSFDGKEVWFENGLNESEGSVVFDVEVLKRILESENIEKIVFYHTHPALLDTNDISQIPSAFDILSDVYLIQLIKGWRPELLCHVESKVVVSTGIYALKYNPEIFFDFEKMGLLEKTSYEVMEENRKVEEGNSEFDYSFPNFDNFGILNKNFASKYSNDFIQITFRDGNDE